MRRHVLVFTTAMLLATAAQAATIHATVDGLVCAFCATGIEKTFKDQPAIAAVLVDMDNKRLTLTTKPEQNMDDATITKLITHAGFTVRHIERLP
jgi:cation transport ATPase